MSVIHPQSEPGKLSRSIAAMRTALAKTEVLTGQQVVELYEYHRRLLDHLYEFAADYEYARNQSPGPDRLRDAAEAAVHLYHRLNGPTPPLVVRWEPLALPANVVALDSFRRAPRDSGRDGGAA
jgi:hypothetical protein